MTRSIQSPRSLVPWHRLVAITVFLLAAVGLGSAFFLVRLPAPKATVLAPAPPFFAAPVAKAWTTDTEPCWAASGAAYDSHLLGRPWDTSGNHVNKLVATGSTGTGLTYEWSQVSGPSTITFSPNATSATVTVGNLVNTTTAAQNYVVHLKVTDSMAATSEVDLYVGAIGIDANGVLIPTNSKVSDLFVALMAFGYNPSCYEDERNAAQSSLQIANNTFPAHSAVWKTPGQGTIDYYFAGKMGAPGLTCTQLHTTINSTATSIVVEDASCLSLSSLPTIIMVAGDTGGFEAVRICNATGVTLTVCHDGRGLVMTSVSNANALVATGHTAGAVVGEFVIKGTSTKFLTDPDRPLSPAGRGPMGTIFYSTGTAGKGANSTTIAGVGGASWTGMAGKIIRLAYTYSSGTPDVYWDFIATNADTTHITMTRPLPSDIDAGTGFTYQIMSPLYLSLEFKDANNTYRLVQNGLACESEVLCYGQGTRDIAAFNSTHQGVDSGTTGIKYSYKTNIGDAGSFGTNWYGTDLASRKFALESGLQAPKDFADSISDYWVQDPEVAAGYAGGLALNLGGGVNGAIIALILGSTHLSWYDVKQFGTGAVSQASLNCNGGDLRDMAYQLGWNALLAYGDPDDTRHMAWVDGLATWATREDGCRRRSEDGYIGAEINSWGTSYNFNPANISPSIGGSPLLTLTGTGTETQRRAITPTVAGTLTSNMCQGADDGLGTIAVVQGSGTAIVVSGSVAANKDRLWINDTTTPYMGAAKYSGSGGAASVITLGYLWPGASGTFTFMVQDAGGTPWNFASIGPDQADTAANNHLLGTNRMCHFTDSNHAELNSAWSGSTGAAFHIFYFNVPPGLETQPFMLGIKAQALYWASKVNSSFLALLGDIGVWAVANTNLYAGAPYALGGACSPPGTPTPGTTFLTTHGELAGGDGDGYCGLSGLYYGASSPAVDRIHNLEGGVAIIVNYLANPTDANRAIGDLYYGYVWGKPGTTAAGFYSDANYPSIATVLGNGTLGSYKYSGFAFSNMFSSEWPAIRLIGLSSGSRRSSATRTCGTCRN